MSYIGNTATQQAFTPAVDFFNGNGSTVAFTLSRPVASVAQVQAVVENVPQKPGDAFTVSGNTITFTSAPPSGTQNIYVYYTSPITQVIAPGQGTVGPTALTAGAPTWSPLGGVTLPRIDSTNEGGQLNFNRASDDTAVWSIDSFGGTSTPTLRFINSATVAMAIDGSNNVGIGTSSPSKKLDVNGSINANSIEVGLNGESIKKASGSLYIETGSANPLIFTTNSAERMRIDSSGNLLVGTTDAGINDKGVVINSAAYLGDNYGRINIKKTFSGNVVGINFSYNNGTVGNITYSNTATAYNTSSDYRLKENIATMTGALAKVSALKPVTYTWKSDGSEGQGFIAHELQEVVPDCVTGEKDAVDADGNPVYQGIDTSFLVATLTAAIQEQQAIIEQLQADVAALKGQ